MRLAPGVLRLVGFLLPTAVLAAFWPPALVVLWTQAVLSLAVVLWFAWRLSRLEAPTCTRDVGSSLPLGEWAKVTLRFGHDSPEPVRFSVFDHHPDDVAVAGLPLELALPPQGWVQAEYRLKPTRRGALNFGRVEVLIRSPFELVHRRLFVGEVETVRVLPDFKPVLQDGLRGVEHQLGQVGVHLQRRRGEGLEFQELRDYRRGDSLRQVDWKATARRRQLISRQYRDEQDQQVVFLLDCGRRMASLEGELTHFDHVLNAVILLSFVALKQGDSVGFLTFSTDEERWFPPAKGALTMTPILDALHDLQPGEHASDYAGAVGRFLSRQRRRALVIMLSNLRDEDTTELRPALRSLATRHVVLLANTRETSLRLMTEQPVESLEGALQVAAGHDYLAARRKAHASLQAGGALSLDVEPRELPPLLVGRYLEIKRAGLL